MANQEDDEWDCADFQRNWPRSDDSGFASTVACVSCRRLEFLRTALALSSERRALCDKCDAARPEVIAYHRGEGGYRLCASCDRTSCAAPRRYQETHVFPRRTGAMRPCFTYCAPASFRSSILLQVRELLLQNHVPARDAARCHLPIALGYYWCVLVKDAIRGNDSRTSTCGCPKNVVFTLYSTPHWLWAMVFSVNSSMSRVYCALDPAFADTVACALTGLPQCSSLFLSCPGCSPVRLSVHEHETAQLHVVVMAK